MSFFFPNSAQSVLSAMDRGLQFDEASGSLSTDWAGAAQQLTENFNALEDYTAAQATAFTPGTLDGAGAAVLPHGITSPFGLLVAQAWCKGATVGQFLPCTIASVDENNVNVSGGVAGRPVRAFLVYSIVPPGW